MAGDRGRASQYPTGSERWTNVTKPGTKLGLYRRQAQRHGMQTEDWGREQDFDSHPSQRLIGSAMQPGRKRNGG